MNDLAKEKQVWKSYLFRQSTMPSALIWKRQGRASNTDSAHSHLEAKGQSRHDMALQREPKRKQKALDPIPCFASYIAHADAAMQQ